MLKLYFSLLISILFFATNFAFGQSSSQLEMKKPYQEGLSAARKVMENKKLWQRGKGDPDMARAYQEGLKSAREGIRNQILWKKEY